DESCFSAQTGQGFCPPFSPLLAGPAKVSLSARGRRPMAAACPALPFPLYPVSLTVGKENEHVTDLAGQTAEAILWRHETFTPRGPQAAVGPVERRGA